MPTSFDPFSAAAVDARVERSLTLYWRDMAASTRISREEEAALAKRIKKGDDAARTEFILANLRLVVSFAIKYQGQGLPLGDLISEGNVGLMYAVDRFNPRKGKFSSYAVWHIRRRMCVAMTNQNHPIRLPPVAARFLKKARLAADEFSAKFQREPSHAELAEIMGVPVSKISRIMSASATPLSFDAPLGNDPDAPTLAHVVIDPSAESPALLAEKSEAIAKLRVLVAKLPAKAAKVMRLRFGLDGETPLALWAVGKQMGVSAERIRQIEFRSLNRLRRDLDRMPLALVACGS